MYQLLFLSLEVIAMHLFSRRSAALIIAMLVLATFGQVGHAGHEQTPSATHEAIPDGPTASPWPIEIVRSVNTDPRISWVILAGPEEGSERVVICSGRTLLKGFVNPEGEVEWQAINEASMCLPGATTANTATPQTDDVNLWTEGRTINTDPRIGWSIMAGPMGGEAAVICDGSVALANSLTPGGEVVLGQYPGVPMCAGGSFI